MRYTIPDTFDPERSERYVLNLRISLKGCSFALYDPLSDGSYHYQEVAYNRKLTPIANLKEFFFDNSFLSLSYKKLQVITYSSLFTCVPSVLYEEKDKEKITAFNFSEKPDKIVTQSLPQSKIQLIYGVNPEVYDFLHRSLSNPQFIHHCSPLISYFQGRSRMGNVKKMIVNPQEDSVDVLCFSQSELLLINNFSCKDEEDMIYYILYIWKHLQLNQLGDHLMITGKKNSREILMERLKPYINHTLPFNIVPEYHLSGIDMKEIPFDLLSLSLCEL